MQKVDNKDKKKGKSFFDFLIKKKYKFIEKPPVIKISKDYGKVKKYKTKELDPTDIWSMSELPYIKLYEKKVKPQEGEKINIKEDINKELLGFKIKRLNKLGRRTPKELWQRFKYLKEGLTLSEWSDRVEGSWENMLEYTEKIWENFFIYSFKKYNFYPYLNKYWADSWYGQNWRNWRREEDAITWQTNSRIPWHKHIRLSNDFDGIKPIKVEKRKIGSRYTFPETFDTNIGLKRIKLNNQIFTDVDRHERLKQGIYNTEKFYELNAWQDSANIYLKYIRPWLMRLNYMDKDISNFKFIGKEQHQKNYQTIAQKNIFIKELFQVSYNLTVIRKMISQKKKGFTEKDFEKKFGKRNFNLYLKNQKKYSALLEYEKQLNLRQTNLNLIRKTKYKSGLNTLNLNKQLLIIFL